MRHPEAGETLLGRYRLEESLGDGGTARVFRAIDEQLGREVAVKVYAAESALSDSDRRRREARALAGLRHPSVVTLFDAHLDAEPAFLVLEYVDGETLASRLTGGALPAVEVREIGVAAAEGLAAAQAAGIVHRDVKPANIVLPRDATPPARLLDFGIAHSLGAARATTLGTVVGSAVYLSPEQARGETVTAASDVYSLGLVLIECLTGRPAFTGSTEEVLHARLLRSPALDDPAVAADAALLARMTALEPADRPSAADVVAALSRPVATRVLPAAAADLPTQPMAPADAPGPVEPPGAPRVPSTGRVAVGAVLGGLGMLAAAVTVTALLTAGGVPTGATPTSDPTTPTPTPVVETPQPEPAGPGNGGPDKPGPGNKDKDKPGTKP
jgi:serine/threonine protein kinase